jgi:hypothetical protein
MILFIPLQRGREERKPELKEQDTGQGERSCLPGLGPGTCDQIQESTSLGNPPSGQGEWNRRVSSGFGVDGWRPGHAERQRAGSSVEDGRAHRSGGGQGSERDVGLKATISGI